MKKVSVSELRQKLPAFLSQVQSGEELAITAHGRVIARLVPDNDPQTAAKARLAGLHDRAFIGDVVSPVAEEWEAQGGRP